MSKSRFTSSQPYRIMIDVRVKMRDGVELSTEVYLPAEGGPFPTLFVRTIYDNQSEPNMASCKRFLEEGYAVVMQDCRGRFDSYGEFDPYYQEAEDGYDTQEWIGAQPWCDGNIGMFGSSYVGYTQSLTAPLRSKYLKAIVPTVSQQDNFGHWRVDGPLQLHVALNFINMAGRTMQKRSQEPRRLRGVLPAAAADHGGRRHGRPPVLYRSAIEHDTFDDFWKAYSLRFKYGEIETPAYVVTGWYDNLMHEGFKQYRGWSQEARTADARRLSKLLVGPWLHGPVGVAAPGAVDFGPDA